MKKRQFIIYPLSFILFLYPLSTNTLLAQAKQPTFCTDMVTKANNLLHQKKYDEARTFCEAALPLCPNAAADLQAVLRDIGKAIDAEKKAAVNGKLQAEKNLKTAKAAQAAEIKSQAATKAALDKLQATAKDAVTILLAEIDRDIMRLEYDSTFKKCETAVKLEAFKEEVAKRILEIAYFYTEADTAEAAVKTLKLLGITAAPNRTDLRAAIDSKAPPQYFTFLEERYYPKMITVEGGTFKMKDDTLEYQVTVNDFLMAQTETTVWQYAIYLKANHLKPSNTPSWQYSGDNPMIYVSWYDAVEYANWVSIQRNKSKVYDIAKNQKDANNLSEYDELKWLVKTNEQAKGYRLPTEAEWEFAARGGNKTHGFEYSGDSVLNNVAWYSANSNSRTHSVKTKKANELGLYDMSGNVWEWCSDWYGRFNTSTDSTADSTSVSNPTGAVKGTGRVFRGGSWGYDAQFCPVADRYYYAPTYRGSDVGFRVVFIP